MKKILTFIGIIIISLIIPYIIISYCLLNFNPLSWDGFMRFLHIFLSIALFASIYACYDDEDIYDLF